MKKAKIFIVMSLCISLLVFAGCGSDNDQNDINNNTTTEETTNNDNKTTNDGSFKDDMKKGAEDMKDGAEDTVDDMEKAADDIMDGTDSKNSTEKDRSK